MQMAVRTRPPLLASDEAGSFMTDPQEWERLYRRTIDAYYEGNHEEGRIACDRLLSMPGVPPAAVGATRRNMVHYAPILRDVLPGYRERALVVPLSPGWSAFNPSIAARDGGYLLTVRTSNYVFEPPTTYYPADGGSTVRTSYQTIDLDGDLEPIGPPRPLIDRTPDDGLLDFLVRDNEDLRPFRVGERWFGTAATWRRMADPPYRMIRYGLFDLDVEAGTIGNPRWLSDGGHGFHEKNWMPAVSGEDLFFVYSVGPTIVLGCDGDSGRLRLAANHAAPGVLGEARGGPPLLPYEDGYLTLTHEVSYWETGARAYLHRLVRFGPDFAVTHATHPFRFHGESIEYALGLARCGDRLVATFGTMDHEAWLAELDAETMLAMLIPVHDLAGAPLVEHELPDRVASLIERSETAQERYAEMSNPWPDRDATWETLLDRSVKAFYEGRFEEGRVASEWVQSDPAAPAGVRFNGRNNSVHYAPRLRDTMPGYREREIVLPLPPGWHAVNPTIAPDGDGLVMLIRATNWSYPHSGPHPESGIPGVRSAYWVQRIGADLDPRGAPVPLEDRTPRDAYHFEPIQGNEDYRLVRLGDRWLASASAWRLPISGPTPVIRMGLFDLDLDSTTPWVGNPRWMSDGTNGIQEKNWMPAVDGDTLSFVYGSLPTMTVRCDVETGRITLANSHAASATASGFRGGAQLLPEGDGWLALVHEFGTWENRARTYMHRILRLGREFNITDMSLPFRIRGNDIEFAAGWTRVDDRFIISFGVDDQSAWVASIPADDLLGMLRPLHELAPRGLLAPGISPGLEGILRQWDPERWPMPEPVPPASDALAALPADGFTPAISPAPTAPGAPLPAAPLTREASVPEAVPSMPPQAVIVGERPFLVSVTMTGSNEDRIGDALRSALPFVDRCVVVDTGAKDRTMAIAREICGDKLVIGTFPWINDFAAARNFSLGVAATTGAVWGMNLDTDERIETNGYDIRAILAASDTDAVFMGHIDGHYEKERFFRLPMRGQYHGPTHEAWWGGSRVTHAGPKFREEWKDDDGLRHKLERDEAILSKHTMENPTDPRWYYYYGDTLANLQKHEEAIAAFTKVIDLDGWDEEAGWAAYRAARILGDNLKKWADAEAMCARGLTRHPAMVELYWCAGYSAYWGGKYSRAAHWARVAVAMNAREDEGFIPPRGGFKYPPARREGPWDVLRHSLRQIGNAEGAEFAEKMHASFINERDEADAGDD